MSSIKNLNVQYHQQDTNYYCGAACAQMVLAEIGTGLLDQNNLYIDNHNHSILEGGWATAPDGLQWTLIHRKPASFTNTFCLDALANEDAISRMIVWTICHYQIAPVALVYGAQHWIVIRGYDVSADPINSIDNSYIINGFDVNNPWPPTPSPAPPPPHTMGDVCGSGGIRGVSNEHIAYSTWQSDYMTGVSFGYWNGKFIAICDPAPSGLMMGKSFRPKPLFNGERIIDKKEAIKSAQTGLKLHGLLKKDGWEKSFVESKVGEPVLVQRLDRIDSFYYIVPYNVSNNISNALISVDAKFGDYKQAIQLSKPAPHLAMAFDKKKMDESVLNNKFLLENQLGQLIIRPEAFCLYPTLVWKPCLESLSPFWPFHMYTIGSQHLYVRIDGVIFTQLHDTNKGI